jgi:hypothetical protein
MSAWPGAALEDYGALRLINDTLDD